MASDPQYAHYPDLSLAQHVLAITNPHSSGASRHVAVQKLTTTIRDLGMAPFYRHLAHPTEGILNGGSGGPADAPGTTANTTTTSVNTSSTTNPNRTSSASQQPAASGGGGDATEGGEEGTQKQGEEGEGEARGGSASGLPASIGSFMTAQVAGDYAPPASSQLIWDEQLYQSLTAQNEAELVKLQKEEDEAAETAGETEILAARGKRAEFYAKIGDKDQALATYASILSKSSVLGTKIDILLAVTRLGLFFGDKAFVKQALEVTTTHVESGGDWDRRNRLKAYKGLHLLNVRAYNLAAPLLLDSLSTFTSYELCSYSSIVVYAVLAGSLSLPRLDFKSKVVDAPEIKAILGDGEEKLSALTGAVSSGPGAGDNEEMKDATAGPEHTAHKTAVSHPTTAVNLTTLGAAEVAEELPIDFSPLATLVRSLYTGNYRSFFRALADVEDQFLTQDRYLLEHRGWFVREMRLRAYQQLLQSYRVVGVASMANEFGVTLDFLDRDLAKFVASKRIACTIDRVNGIIETNRPDDKNKQYADLVRQGDALITKLQKYGQAVRMRGGEQV